MTDHRQRLAETIAVLPGIHFNELVRRLDLAPGQVQYHVRALLEDGAIVRTPVYGRTHYFPPHYDPFQRGALALCHRETARDVLLCLLETEARDPASVADDLGIARGTLEWHLTHLVEQGLLEKRRDEHDRVELVLTRPEATLRLLADIEPALPERLVDRFTRLVDRLLDE